MSPCQLVEPVLGIQRCPVPISMITQEMCRELAVTAILCTSPDTRLILRELGPYDGGVRIRPA